MNVLITSASRKVALVKAFQSALARCGGGRVIAVDISPYAPALYMADRHFLVPRSTEPCFVETLANLCQREEVALVIPTRDEELPLFAEARQTFEYAGAKVMVPSLETVRTCQDKQAFLAFCRARGFGIPRTYEGDEWRGTQFPLFVKPRFGKGSAGVKWVASEVELQSLLGTATEWIIQECVTSLEYTIDLFADFNGQVLSAVPRLRQLVIGGESYVSRTTKQLELIAQSVGLATAIGLVGHNTIQCFSDGRETKFIEVNPRFGGAAAMGIAAGVDSPTMLLRLLQGETIPPKLGEFEDNLVMLRFTDDLFLKANALASALVEPSTEKQKERSRTGFQAVLLDLDNTLYPEEEFVRGGFRAAAKCLADRNDLDPDALARRMLEILLLEGRGRVFDVLLEELHLPSDPWRKILLLAYRSHQPQIALYPETLATLNALQEQGIRLGIVTDGLASVQRRKIAALRLDRRMDVVVCTDELGNDCAKPSTVPFEVATTLLGVPPEHVAYVGDDMGKDFAGPNQLGMKTVCLRSSGLIGVPSKDAPNTHFAPQVRIESISQLLNTLELRSV